MQKTSPTNAPAASRRIDSEKRVVATMIRMYCRRKEGNEQLCPHCADLLDYAHRRLDRCLFADRKPTCRRCPVHCYSPQMREQIRAVMRYAGPRMLIRHPARSLRHFFIEFFR